MMLYRELGVLNGQDHCLNFLINAAKAQCYLAFKEKLA